MKSLSNFIEKIANWKSLVALLAIYMLFNVYFLKNAENEINKLAGKTIGVIDLTFSFDPNRTLNMMADYGASARSYYARTEMTTDVLYPIVYAFLLGVILTLLYRNKSYKPHAFINLLPFSSLAFDYLENLNIVTLLNTFPEQSYTIAVLCEIFKMLKWLSFGFSVFFILYGLIRLVKK